MRAARPFVREALTNIQRHVSHVSHLSVSVQVGPITQTQTVSTNQTDAATWNKLHDKPDGAKLGDVSVPKMFKR